MTGRLSCGHSETGQTNRRDANLDGHALNGRSKTALNSAVVRSSHSRPASFRCRFQNARSVRLMTRHCVRKSGQHAARLMRKILREGSHDLCEFESGGHILETSDTRSMDVRLAVSLHRRQARDLCSLTAHSSATGERNSGFALDKIG